MCRKELSKQAESQEKITVTGETEEEGAGGCILEGRRRPP